MGQAKQSDHDLITQVNFTVHGGDAAVDSLLDDGVDGRENAWVFEKLYGIHPSHVKKICE